MVNEAVESVIIEVKTIKKELAETVGNVSARGEHLRQCLQ